MCVVTAAFTNEWFEVGECHLSVPRFQTFSSWRHFLYVSCGSHSVCLNARTGKLLALPFEERCTRVHSSSVSDDDYVYLIGGRRIDGETLPFVSRFLCTEDESLLPDTCLEPETKTNPLLGYLSAPPKFKGAFTHPAFVMPPAPTPAFAGSRTAYLFCAGKPVLAVDMSLLDKRSGPIDAAAVRCAWIECDLFLEDASKNDFMTSACYF